MQNPAMSPAITEAYKRREQGNPQPIMNQTSSQAPMANPVPGPMPISDMTQASSPPDTKPVSQPKFQPQNQNDLIVMALTEQLKNNNKLEKQQSQIPAQPAPQGGGMTKIPNHMMPMGGGFSMSPGFEQPMPVSQMQGDYANGLGKDYSGLNGYGKGGF